MAPQLFVYYRLRVEHLGVATAAMQRLHAAWRAEDPALDCGLMRRVDGDGANGVVTLMETYRRVGGVPPAWQQRITQEAQAALADWVEGERHVEVFAPCA